MRPIAMGEPAGEADPIATLVVTASGNQGGVVVDGPCGCRFYYARVIRGRACAAATSLTLGDVLRRRSLAADPGLLVVERPCGCRDVLDHLTFTHRCASHEAEPRRPAALGGLTRRPAGSTVDTLPAGEILTARTVDPAGVVLNRSCGCRLRCRGIVAAPAALPLRPGLELRVAEVTPAGSVLELVRGPRARAVRMTLWGPVTEVSRYSLGTDDGPPVVDHACATHAWPPTRASLPGARPALPGLHREQGRGAGLDSPRDRGTGGGAR